MLRFGQNKRRSVRNYSLRREQLRLLALFVPLALVILVMGRLRDPKAADAIKLFFTPTAQESVIKPRPTVASSATLRSPKPFPGIRADLLKTIADNTYFRTAEKDAWFHFIELMRNNKDGTTQGVPVEYAQLVDQPNAYRGTLVTVRGTARQVTREKPAENDLGIESYFRVVIQPDDGANLPVIVYCLTVPKDVSPGDELAFDVAVTGLFFKKLSYQWRDGLGIAPVILASNLTADMTPTAAAAQKPPSNDLQVSSTDRSETPGAVGLSANPREAFLRIMSLAGWDHDRLAQFEKGESLSDAQRAEVLQLLRRLRSIDSVNLEDWAQFLPSGYELINPDEVRGKLYRLVGRVTKVTKRATPAADAERLEMPEYYECEFQVDNKIGSATIITARVPTDWLDADALDEPATAVALHLKRLANGTPRTLWLAKEIAWHPGINNKPNDSDDMFRDALDPLLGKSVLGALGVDVGLLDQVQSRGRIRAEEGPAFYQVVRAAALVEPQTLVRIARGHLPIVKREWEEPLHADGSARDKALAREVVKRADEGAHSAALLFNKPQSQIGRLFTFDGVARRAVRVEVNGAADGDGPRDLARRYGIDHYYELEVFTNDSQNYPLVFCVRTLPKDFPVGPDIRVPVRVAGFFFKNWLYNTRGRGQSEETANAKSSGPPAQFAPLLIGSAPIVLPAPQSAARGGRFVIGGLFIAALLGIWAAAAWFARDDRRFRQRTAAAKFMLPAGQSLNDLNLPTANVPMTTEVVVPHSGESTE